MGKKRVTQVGEKAKKERKVVKTGKERGRLADVGGQALKEAEIIEQKTRVQETVVKKKPTKKKIKPRGKAYQKALKKIDRQKFYPLSEAIKLLKEISISKFKGSVDVHLVLRKSGVKGEVEFPYPTSKTSRVAIADDELLKQIEKGKIDFTSLVASPAMMPKLAKFAKILGPRGLMPNPKAGTITEKPEELAKKLAGKTKLASETKAPLIHMTIGKIDLEDKKLAENLKALIEAVGRRNIAKAVLAPSMGPGIKINLDSLS